MGSISIGKKFRAGSGVRGGNKFFTGNVFFIEINLFLFGYFFKISINLFLFRLICFIFNSIFCFDLVDSIHFY